MNQVKEHANCPRKTKASRKMLVRIAGCAAALIAGAFTMTPAWALTSCPAPPAYISTCCVADQPGTIYALQADIAPATATGCMRISAPNVVFIMKGYNIAGKGSGIGIHVLSTARNAVIEGDYDYSGVGTISDFATGLKTDAPNTIVGLLVALSNGRGMVFNGRNDLGSSVSATGNTKNGITLTSNASGSYLLDAQANSNGTNGIVLRGTTGVTISRIVADQNNGYGLWLKGASSNFVSDGELEGNIVAGAYLGCHPDGPNPAGCAIPPSNGNSISGGGEGSADPLTVGSCPGGAQFEQPYGVIIDKGNGHNHVIGVVADSNYSNCTSPLDKIYDGYDGNSGVHCRGNVWLFDAWPALNQNHVPYAVGCMN